MAARWKLLPEYLWFFSAIQLYFAIAGLCSRTSQAYLLSPMSKRTWHDVCLSLRLLPETCCLEAATEAAERLKPSMCRDTYANYFPVKYFPSPGPPFKFMLAAGGGVIVAYINVPHLFIAAIINDRNTVNTYTVGTYSPGKLSVVYEMSIHVLPTVPSPTTTHLIGRPGWAMIGQILQQITTCCLFERSISVSDSTQYTYPS